MILGLVVVALLVGAIVVMVGELLLREVRLNGVYILATATSIALVSAAAALARRYTRRER